MVLIAHLLVFQDVADYLLHLLVLKAFLEKGLLGLLDALTVFLTKGQVPLFLHSHLLDFVLIETEFFEELSLMSVSGSKHFVGFRLGKLRQSSGTLLLKE